MPFRNISPLDPVNSQREPLIPGPVLTNNPGAMTKISPKRNTGH